jgi:tetratricopeptide (TPR) repeat protein
MVARRVRPRARSADLAGREVVVVGRLSALTRAEAHERLAAAGGALAEALGDRTVWVVLAGGAVPLDANGALTFELEEARARIERGQELELVSEEEFLARLGLAREDEPSTRLYTSSQLARILDLPPRRIQAWVRAGLIKPVRTSHRLASFEFREVAQAKALARLTAQGVPPRRIQKSLRALARWWPAAESPLLQLEALEARGKLLVRTDEGDLAEPSGQLWLDFPPEGVPGPTVPDSELWFQRALRLEDEERLEEAVLAYGKALDPARPRADISFNLGNALYALGRYEDAARALTLSTELDPDYLEAWNNLGNALSQLGRHAEACERFERALALEPDYGDAHFNLAESLAASGETERARRHWRAYLTLDPDSLWAAEVRARLRRTDRASVP